MTPEAALQRVIHCLDRALASPYKTRAFIRALDVVRVTDPVELAERARDGRLTELDGIGDATASVITEALAGLTPSYLEVVQAILDRIPAGRWGAAEDIAQTAVFLSAPASDYVHGAVINVDGGWLAR